MLYNIHGSVSGKAAGGRGVSNHTAKLLNKLMI